MMIAEKGADLIRKADRVPTRQEVVNRAASLQVSGFDLFPFCAEDHRDQVILEDSSTGRFRKVGIDF